MKYCLYHDESKVDGYWHGMLLVPEKEKDHVVDHLRKARENTHYRDPIGIKNIRRSSGRIFTCAEAWMLLAVGAMRTKIGDEVYPVHYGERERNKLKYSPFRECLGLKFILFRSVDDHQRMALLATYAQRVETTFRVGLKGGMHYLGTNQDPIDVVSMHFDGHEHYGRHIDYARIVGRLTGLRRYCGVPEDKRDIHDHPSDHRKCSSEEYADCQLLQLTDLMIGAFRTRLGHHTSSRHETFGHIAGLPLEAYQRGYTGYMNSRWASSLWMSQCQVVNGEWEYTTLDCERANVCSQMELAYGTEKHQREK